MSRVILTKCEEPGDLGPRYFVGTEQRVHRYRIEMIEETVVLSVRGTDKRDKWIEHSAYGLNNFFEFIVGGLAREAMELPPKGEALPWGSGDLKEGEAK